MENRTVLFVGRFQPVHKGHERLIRSLLAGYRFLIVVVGSINKSGLQNPFSFEERRRMLESLLSAEEGRWRIIGVDDVDEDRVWADALLRKARFDIVISGNQRVRKCFRGAGIPVSAPTLLRPEEYSGTHVRDMIRSGRPWHHLVPEEIIPLIEAFAEGNRFLSPEKQNRNKK